MPSYTIVDCDPVDPGAESDPMTEEQTARLRKLTPELDEPMDAALSRLQAAKRIAALVEIRGGA